MKTISQIKKEWQTHNRDNGLSWNEVSQLVDEVVECMKGPCQNQVGTKMSAEEWLMKEDIVLNSFVPGVDYSAQITYLMEQYANYLNE